MTTPCITTIDFFEKRITAKYQRGLDIPFEIGEELIRAKEGDKAHTKLQHGQWQELVTKLPFVASVRTAQMYMSIARNVELQRLRKIGKRKVGKRSNASLLPADYTVLYLLSRLDRDQLRDGVKRGIIHAKMTREDVKSLMPGITDTDLDAPPPEPKTMMQTFYRQTPIADAAPPPRVVRPTVVVVHKSERVFVHKSERVGDRAPAAAAAQEAAPAASKRLIEHTEPVVVPFPHNEPEDTARLAAAEREADALINEGGTEFMLRVDAAYGNADVVHFIKKRLAACRH